MKRSIKTAAQRILAHGCVICGMAVVTFQILDWYNPYMDFLGHAGAVLALLCFCAVALGFFIIFGGEPSAVHRHRERRGEGGEER